MSCLARVRRAGLDSDCKQAKEWSVEIFIGTMVTWLALLTKNNEVFCLGSAPLSYTFVYPATHSSTVLIFAIWNINFARIPDPHMQNK